MSEDKARNQYFTKLLLAWHEQENNRSLPWKEEKDPYKIWLSEIILQQTRAEQGLPYYLKFIEHFPTIKDLAAAEDETVFKLWQGLGYYNRCKNLLCTAKTIAEEYDGIFPDKYEQIITLKGVGTYTAAAIASFGFGLPYAVVDGNVIRVLSRFFGIETPFDTTIGKKLFQDLAQELLPSKQNKKFNQAIMDFGATICTPKSVQCDVCFLAKKCFAFQHEVVKDLPLKSKKITVKARYFNYFLIINKDKIWVQKRTENDIWQNLHEFYLYESVQELEIKELEKIVAEKHILHAIKLKKCGKSKQRLTHQLISSQFYQFEIQEPIELNENGFWQPISELNKLAFPKTLVSFIENNFYF